MLSVPQSRAETGLVETFLFLYENHTYTFEKIDILRDVKRMAEPPVQSEWSSAPPTEENVRAPVRDEKLTGFRGLPEILIADLGDFREFVDKFIYTFTGVKAQNLREKAHRQIEKLCDALIGPLIVLNILLFKREISGAVRTFKSLWDSYLDAEERANIQVSDLKETILQWIKSMRDRVQRYRFSQDALLEQAETILDQKEQVSRDFQVQINNREDKLRADLAAEQAERWAAFYEQIEKEERDLLRPFRQKFERVVRQYRTLYPDSGSDADSDLGLDLGSDLGLDLGSDLGLDLGSDLGSGSDSGSDADPYLDFGDDHLLRLKGPQLRF